MEHDTSPEASSSRKRKLQGEIDYDELVEIHRLLESDDFEEIPQNDAIVDEFEDEDPFAEELVFNEEELIVLSQLEKKNPLFIPEIIHKVFDYFDTKTLKTCRRVCSNWNANASHIMLKRNNLQIIVKYRDEIRRRVNPAYAYTVADLRQYMCKSNGTPSLSFHLATKYFHESQVQDFLNDFGLDIVGLHIKCEQVLNYNFETVIDLFRQLLIRYAPNIQNLTLELSDSVYIGDRTKRAKYKLFECNKDSPILSKLKSLTITNLSTRTKDSNMEVINDILECARNLEDFRVKYAAHRRGRSRLDEKFILNFADDLIATRRTSAVKSIIISLHQIQKHMAIWNRFSEANPNKLETLNLQMSNAVYPPEQCLDIANIVNNIFRASRLSLRSVTMEAVSILPQLVLPCLWNVTDLCLNGSQRHGVTTYLNPSTRHDCQEMYKIFPNIKRLTFSQCLGEVLLENCLTSFINPSAPSSTLPSVIEVTAMTWPHSARAALQHLSNLFPNLQNISIRPADSRSNLSLFVKHIVQNFPRLKFLKLQNFFLNTTRKKTFVKAVMSLDCAFTGISFDTLKKKRRIISKSTNNLERWITGPSLKDLRDLVSIEIELCVGMWSNFDTLTRSKNSHTLLSISADMLKKVPRVKINLSGDVDKGEWNMERGVEFDYKAGVQLYSLLNHARPIVEVNLRRFHGFDSSEEEEDFEYEYDDYRRRFDFVYLMLF